MQWSSWHNHTGNPPHFSYCASVDLTPDYYRRALRTGPWQSFALTEHAFAIALPPEEAWPHQWYFSPEKLWAHRAFREDKTAKFLERIATDCDGERLFSGMEAEVGCDGTLSMDDALWPYLDVVIGSIHYMPGEKDGWYNEHIRQLQMLLQHPVDILGHPLRSLASCGEIPEEIIDETLRCCKLAKVAIEINAHIPSADDARLLTRAVHMGLPIAFSLDAHHCNELALHSYFAQVLKDSGVSYDTLTLFQPVRNRAKARAVAL